MRSHPLRRARVIRRPLLAAPVGENVVAFGETLVDVFADRQVLGGAPYNVACHLAGLGAQPLLVTRVGKDTPGQRLLRDLRSRGMDPRGVQRDAARPTGRVMVEETPQGHRFDILDDQAYDHIHPVMARMAGLAAHPAWIVFGTLAQRGESAHALAELLASVDARAFLDVNLRDPWVERDTLAWSMEQADVIKLNGEELARIAALFGVPDAAPEQRARTLIERFGIDRAIVTDGPNGAWSVDREGETVRVPGQPLERLVDTVGAGDAFSAACVLGLVRGWPVPLLLARANELARALCGVRGAVPADTGFYRQWRDAWRTHRAATQA